MRYTYLGNALTDDSLKGLQCDPVRREDGKCIISVKLGSALVEDEQGRRYVVSRRRLRVNKEQEMKYKLYNDDRFIGAYTNESDMKEGAMDYFFYEVMDVDVPGVYISDHTAVIDGLYVIICHVKHGVVLNLQFEVQDDAS